MGNSNISLKYILTKITGIYVLKTCILLFYAGSHNVNLKNK